MPDRATQYRTTRTVRTPSEATRGSRHERGYTNRWYAFAKLYLRAHPLCVLCAPRVVAATCVDHIDNMGPLGERGYDETNLRALCTRCHNSRSAKDRHAKRRET